MTELTAKKKRVPWKSTSEWLCVKNNVISQNPNDLVRGYELLLMWKIRCPNLPVHVECTLGILQVLVKGGDLSNSKDTLFNKEENLQLCYSTALLRFVNHVSASTSPQGDTLYLVAHKQNIPDWVVNLRHDIAHSATLPPFPLLEAAILLGKQWLIENYWEPMEKNLMCVDGSLMNARPNPSSDFVQAILKQAINVWWISRPSARSETIQTGLTDAQWQCVLDFSKKVADFKLVKHENVVQNLQSIIDSWEKEPVHFQGKEHPLRKIEKNVLKLLNILYNKENKKLKNCLLDGLVDAGFLKSAGSNLNEWTPILQVLHKVDSLQVLLEFLFAKLGGINIEEATYAEGWLNALAPSLDNLRIRWKSFMEKENTEIPDCKGDKYLLLSLREPPHFNLEILRPSLMNPTSSTYSIVTRYIKFANPCISKHARSVIQELIQLFSNKSEVEIPMNTNDLTDIQLFSVKDLEMHFPSSNCNGQHVSQNNERWQKVIAEQEIWRRCSIGILPSQVDPNFELPSMHWYQVKQNSRKRKAVEELICEAC